MHALSLTFCFVTICQKTNLQLANPQTTISQKTNLQHLLSLPGVKIFWIFFHKNYQNKLFHLWKCSFVLLRCLEWPRITRQSGGGGTALSWSAGRGLRLDEVLLEGVVGGLRRFPLFRLGRGSGSGRASLLWFRAILACRSLLLDALECRDGTRSHRDRADVGPGAEFLFFRRNRFPSQLFQFSDQSRFLLLFAGYPFALSGSGNFLFQIVFNQRISVRRNFKHIFCTLSSRWMWHSVFVIDLTNSPILLNKVQVLVLG